MATARPIPLRKYAGNYVSDWAGEKIAVICEQCNIRRIYDADAMLARLEWDMPMVSLIDKLQIAIGCELACKWVHYSDPKCRMVYDGAIMELGVDRTKVRRGR